MAADLSAPGLAQPASAPAAALAAADPRPLAIVGAGPVGLALALRLVHDGRSGALALVDAGTLAQARADPRVLALSAGSLRRLAALGLAPRIDAAQAAPIRSIRVLQRSTRPTPPLFGLLPRPSTALDAAEHGLDMLGCTLKYGALVELLAAALAERAPRGTRLDWRQATRVRRIDADAAGGVALQLAPAAAGAESFPPGDAAAAAGSGAAATLAARAALVAEGGRYDEQPARALHRDYGQTALLATLRAEHAAPGLAVECFTDDGPLALLPQPGAAGCFALVWCVRSADAEPLRALAPADFAARVQALLALPALGRLRLESAPQAAPLGLNARRRLVEGRSVYLGNAAQTLHPVAGQGFNLGLRDAWALADLLRDHGDDLDAALAAYPAARRRDRQALIGLTDTLARAFAAPALAPLGAAGLAALALAAPLRQRFAALMMDGWR
jgi:2-octaprenyl-6-methoxyphenol hydroxylase